ncbi:50S ribosomal protein L25 [bacterium]|nr:50S ribosomal protein L25 [bacterium]
MHRVDVEIAARPATGKGACRKLRATGRLPVTLYGEGQKPLSLSVDRHSFHHLISSEKGRHAILNLKSAGEDALGIVKDVQFHPLTGLPIHVDLLRIALDHKVSTSVPLHFVGTPEGVRNAGGVLETPLRELEIECLPMDIPDFIPVNVEPLGVGQTLHVHDLVVDEKIHVLTNPDTTLASVLAPTVEKVEAPVEAPVEGEAAPAATAEAGKESA